MSNQKPTYQELENRLQELEAKLKERVKELNCISELSKLTGTKETVDEVLTDFVHILKKSWQFPEITEVKITNKSYTYKTENFKETDWVLYSDIVVENKKAGEICIVYLENNTKYKDPFLKEEYNLLHVVSEQLGKTIERLRKNKRFAELFNTLCESIIKANKNGIITEVNPETVKLTGYNSPNELIGKPISDLYANPEIRDDLIKKIKQEGGELWNIEILLKRKDNSTLPVLCNIRMLFNQKGEYTGTLGALRDISKRKQAEQALKKSEALLNETGKISKTGGWYYYVKEDKHLWTEESYRIHEVEPDFVPSLEKGIGFYDTPSQKILSHALEEAVSNAIPYDLELKIITAKNNKKDVRTIGQPIKNKRGEIIALIGSLQDITERKIAESALKESEAQKNAILNGISARIGFIDKNLRFIWVNNTAAKSTSMSPEEMIGKHCYALWANPNKVCDGCPAKKAIQTGKTSNNTITTPDGKIWEAKGEPVFDEKGHLIGVVEIAQEITEKVKAEQALRASEKMLREKNDFIEKQNTELTKLNEDKDKFISVLAHDLKGPFNSLLGYSGLLAKNVHRYDTEKINEQATIINQVANNTFNLLENILEWSRAQSGRIPYQPIVFNVRDVLEHLLQEESDSRALAKDISLNNNTAPGIKACTDIDLVKTTVRNLISNAIKFTGKGGFITLDATETTNEIVVSVADTGVGIQKEVLSNIFNISGTMTTPGTEKEKGTGLGLQICKEFVEKIGGKIWVESVAGKGSVFYFTIPRIQQNIAEK